LRHSYLAGTFGESTFFCDCGASVENSSGQAFIAATACPFSKDFIVARTTTSMTFLALPVLVLIAE
jgi:hypothetical protein